MPSLKGFKFESLRREARPYDTEIIERPEVRAVPRVYAMTREELDPINVSRDTISIYNTFEYVLIDLLYEMKEDGCRTNSNKIVELDLVRQTKRKVKHYNTEK